MMYPTKHVTSSCK